MNSRGRVIRLHGKQVVVVADNEEITCRIAGRLKKGKRTSHSPVAVGDWVAFVHEEHSAEDGKGPLGTVEEVEDRKTTLSRSSPHNTRIEQVVAANVDQLLIMFSADDIEIHLALIDRLIVAAGLANLRAVLAVNKVDLPGSKNCRDLMRPYEDLDLPVVFLSALKSEGLEDLRKILKDRTTVFAGPSGVGKSTSLNALQPGLKLRTNEVKATGAGRHTTTHVSLIPLDFGGFVVDTPGVREFGLWNFPKDELGLWYPEFNEYRTQCRYTGCTHTHEPECAVKLAAEDNSIDAARYERYVQIFEELCEEETKPY